MSEGIPWKRVVVEGAVIVGSILLAFAIDAAWQERQERIDEREILEALHDDFSTSLNLLERRYGTHEVAEDRMSRLAHMTDQEILALPPDSAEAFIQAMVGPYTFDPVTGTLDALVGAGALGIVRDDELRRALASFLNRMDDVEEDARYLQEFAIRAWAAMAPYGGQGDVPAARSNIVIDFGIEPDARHLLRLRSDPEVFGLVRQLRFNGAVYRAELDDIRVDMERIVERVEAQRR